MKRSHTTLLGTALAMTIGLSPAAQAADYLRGSYAGHQEPKSTAIDWSGVYGGVLAGFGVVQTDPRAFADPLSRAALPNASPTQELLRNTINFKQKNKTGVGLGGFVGVNWVWDDVVLGFEADYTRSNIASNQTTGPYGLQRMVGSDEWAVTSTSTARARITDWGSLRLRAGYAMGYIMPFITGGLAIGNVDGRASTTGTWTQTNIAVGPPLVRTPVAAGAFNGVVGRRGVTYGGALGAGVDIAFFSNFFVRAEWQHIQFASGGSRPEISMNTARVAGAVKF